MQFSHLTRLELKGLGGRRMYIQPEAWISKSVPKEGSRVGQHSWLKKQEQGTEKHMAPLTN